MNYYEILGISKTATEEEIKKAYRTLAKQYHPDRNPGDKDAEEKFKKVQEAYDTLSDATKKRDYDYMGQGTDELDDTYSMYRGPFDTYDEYFQNIFGNMPTEGEHGDHIIIQVKTDLEGVLKGSKLDIEFSRKDLCEDCCGRGGTLDKCRQCNGSGWYIIRGKNATVKRGCPTCNGSGKSISNQCKDCNGSGFGPPKTDRLVSVIPPGVTSGKQFAFKGRGNPGRNGGRPGNVFVMVTVEDHELFKRGPDGSLHCEVPVTYTQLVLGDEIEIPTLDHKKLGFRIPPGTQSGAKFRLQKQGLPKRLISDEDVKPNDLGDMFVEIKLETPVNLKQEQIEIMEKLAKYDESGHYPLKKEYEKKKERIVNECTT